MPWYDEPLTHGYYTSIDGPDTPHYARDYATKWHEQVTSLVSGTVTSETGYEPWGGQVFIKPDVPSPEEFYVYHLDVINVHPGQHVNATRDVIGLAGGENTEQVKQHPGSYPGAKHPADPKWTTGLHTHTGWKEKYIKTNWEDTNKVVEHNVTLPYGPDIGSLIDWYREGQTTAPPDTLISNPPSSGGTNPSTGQVDPGKDYSKPKTDSDGCVVPTNWTDAAAVNDYLNCKAGAAGKYVVRGVFMLFGIVLVITGIRIAMQPESENTFIGGQAPASGGTAPTSSNVKEGLKAFAFGAIGGAGGEAGAAIARRVGRHTNKPVAQPKSAPHVP